MRRFGLWVVNYIIRFAFWFRYRIEVVGIDKVDAFLKKHPGGTLFLPNHVAVLLDPLMIAISMWPQHEARPLIVDYMYKIPLFNSVLRMQNALAVPNMDDPKHRVSREKIEEINNAIVAGLKKGDYFHIYPAGRLKSSPIEILGGASMVYNVVQQYPEVNIILVRAKGLWGSTFSKAYTGNVTPDIAGTIVNGIKTCFKNLLFFTPRRRVVIEFEPAPADFPRKGATKREFNEWLERWYNRPDGLSKQVGDFPGESLVQVSLSRWRDVYPVVKVTAKNGVQAKIPANIEQSVKEVLSEITDKNISEIKPEQSLGCDLSMDSIDLVDAVLILEKKHHIRQFPYHDITTVKELMQKVAGAKV